MQDELEEDNEEKKKEMNKEKEKEDQRKEKKKEEQKNLVKNSSIVAKFSKIYIQGMLSYSSIDSSIHRSPYIIPNCEDKN